MTEENIPQSTTPPTPEAVQRSEMSSAQTKGSHPPPPQDMQRSATGGGQTSEGDSAPKN